MHKEILENNDWGDEEREKTPGSGSICSTITRDFTLSPASIVPSLPNYDADHEGCNHEVETQITDAMFTPFDP